VVIELARLLPRSPQVTLESVIGNGFEFVIL
jgi:hypothetical protein